MIEYKTTGNILEEDAEALVNTVNCVGVMGRGIALEFKKKFKDNFVAYADACERGEVRPGKMFVFETGINSNPHYIINFPTKRHWRGPSRIKDIKEGLASLGKEIRKRGIRSIAIPALGCGLGGLEWKKVSPLIEQAVQDFEDVQISIFAPKDEPARKVVSSRAPRMTLAGAALVSLMHSYLNGQRPSGVTLLDAHKLMYFMQCAGEKSKLEYVKKLSGPYADKLHDLIKKIDGHLINGYADGGDRLDRKLALVPEAIKKAQDFLSHDKRTRTRDYCDRVKELIEGFETPFDLELLSKTHWVVVKEKARSESEILEKFDNWSPDKYQFDRRQIMNAIEVLRKKEWITEEHLAKQSQGVLL